MKCAACPFSLQCLRGSLGHPYPLRLCPKCKYICFIVDEYITVDVNMHSHRTPSMPTVEERKNAHIFTFRCEKRVITDRYVDRILVVTPKEDFTRRRHELVVTVDDPAPFGHPFVQLRYCVHCAGQFAEAHLYWQVMFHQLDAGDAMPKL